MTWCNATWIDTACLLRAWTVSVTRKTYATGQSQALERLLIQAQHQNRAMPDLPAKGCTLIGRVSCVGVGDALTASFMQQQLAASQRLQELEQAFALAAQEKQVLAHFTVASGVENEQAQQRKHDCRDVHPSRQVPGIAQQRYHQA